jgi:hypothetical protein
MRQTFVLTVIFAACAGEEAATPGAESISAVVTTDQDSVARIVIASTTNLCSDVRASIDRQNQTLITIELADVAGAATTAPTAAGTYTIYPNTGSRPAKSASLTTGRFDSACSLDEDGSGQSGSVILTTVAAGKYAGSYDVVLNTGERVSGTFDPQVCAELGVSSSNTCKP